MNERHNHSNRRRFTLPAKAVFIGFVAIAAFFLLTEHRAHLYGYLPFILLALCPLMHLFHGGHGGHRGDGEQEPRKPSRHSH